MTDLHPRTLAARRWFGYGRWDAPYWFVGMEPGGDDDLAWYQTWMRLGGSELCDCRQHHLGTGFYRWHDDLSPSPQRTWIFLIQLLLSYLGKPSDKASACAYQRDHWGALDGETALLEISAIRARNLAETVDRQAYRDERLTVLKERLASRSPNFVVFYGTTYRSIYEQIIEGSFDANGYFRRRGTLCVLVRHPANWGGPTSNGGLPKGKRCGS